MSMTPEDAWEAMDALHTVLLAGQAPHSCLCVLERAMNEVQAMVDPGFAKSGGTPLRDFGFDKRGTFSSDVLPNGLTPTLRTFQTVPILANS